MADEPIIETGTNGDLPAPGPVPVDPAEQGWRKDKQNRWFTPAKGRSGVVYRKDNETPDEAHARDAKGPRDRPPRSKKTSSVPKAPAPTQIALKDLEFALLEVLSTPAMIAGMQGDEWAVGHFEREAPVLARNLTKAAEHNPWLRSKLERAVTGEDLLVKVMTVIPVAAALIAYAFPPVIYYLNPGFIPAQAREMFQVPDRGAVQAAKQKEADASSSASAEGPARAEPASAGAPAS